MPVTGIMPMVIPTDWKSWNKNMASTPVHTSRPNTDEALRAVRQIRYISRL